MMILANLTLRMMSVEAGVIIIIFLPVKQVSYRIAASISMDVARWLEATNTSRKKTCISDEFLLIFHTDWDGFFSFFDIDRI